MIINLITDSEFKVNSFNRQRIHSEFTYLMVKLQRIREKNSEFIGNWEIGD